MIRNYIKIAFRNLMKHKFVSFINLSGLTIGLACCLLITLYILHELSYDRFHHNANRIYRVTRSFNQPDGKISLFLNEVAPPFGPLLQNDFPDIQKVTTLLPTGNVTVRYADKTLNETNAFFADENLFKVFDFSVTRGNSATALSDPYSIMLSEEMARKYFGNDDPINKMVLLGNLRNFKVTGVYRSLPVNSHFHPELLISFPTLKDSTFYGEENLRTNWGNNAFLTYLLLPENYPVAQMEKQFPAFLDKHMPHGDNYLPSQGTRIYLQKLTDIHLRSHLDAEVEENGDIKRVYIFSVIAIFILVIACINYMNLTTARSVLRAREIGIRKVAGAERKTIITQFLVESVLITYIAMAFAVALTAACLHWINQLSGQQLTMQTLLRMQVIIPVLLLPIVVGILSGIYPAVFLSSFNPAKVLKGLFKLKTGSFSLRQTLVVVQFSISIILIISTMVVFNQLRFIQQKSLGYNRDQVVTMPNRFLGNGYESFKNELLRYPGIKSVGRSSRIPTGRLLDAQGAEMPGTSGSEPVKTDVKCVTADADFIPTYGIRIVAGRNFSQTPGADSASFIINETTVKALGWKSNEEAIGKPFIYGGVRGNIVGVINDFNFESLHEKIVPLILLTARANLNGYNRISVKITGQGIPATLARIEDAWHRFLPDVPYTGTFLNERFNALYQTEQRQGALFTLFACLAIFIASMGLLGLSSFTISQRMKEIGVRKVLGASMGNLVGLLSVNFIKLVLIAALIAFPVAWFAMDRWLQNFAYRSSISWWLFAAAGLIAALIALATISFQTIRAALANPVKSLRTE
jgi:putative ABC transport system permease protein